MLSPARPSFVRRHGLGRIPRFVPLPTLSIKLSGTGHGRPELGSCPTERITPAVQDAGFELAVRWTAAPYGFRGERSRRNGEASLPQRHRRGPSGSKARHDHQQTFLVTISLCSIERDYDGLSFLAGNNRRQNRRERRDLNPATFPATYFADFGRPVRPGLPNDSSLARRTHARGIRLSGSASATASNRSLSVPRPCFSTADYTSE
jgi:hypothetical protein